MSKSGQKNRFSGTCCKVYGISTSKLAVDFSELVTLGFSMALALGGMWVLFSGVDNDDDDEGGGEGSPVYQPVYSGASA